MKKLILAAFVLMVIAQWIVPIQMIMSSEAVLTAGEVYKFKTQPIDPSDPFRGRYVVLNFDVEQFETDTLRKFEQDQEVYAQLTNDKNGFVKITELFPERPEVMDNTILKTRVGYAWPVEGKQRVSLRLPFDRFYVEESKAQAAEQVYWDAQRDTLQITYALVRVHNGQAIIENVMINDRPILEIVREMNEKSAQP
jgi:uncharacterized membrane-anchored protein